MWYKVKDNLAIDSMFYNFLPSWWNKNYGIIFGKKYVFDPDYRVETFMFMERTVKERFPDLHIGSGDPEPTVIGPDFGNTITAAAAGCEVVYPDDNYPWNKHLPEEAIGKLKVPQDLGRIFPYKEILSQVGYLNGKLHQNVKPCWNSRGVQNDAALIKGSGFFTDYYENPEAASKLLNYSYSMLTSVVKHNHDDFGYRDMVILTNCTSMMVSPKTYDEWLLDYDRKIYQLTGGFGQEFGIHHCGIFDKYSAEYRKMPHLDWLEIGWDSDIKGALDSFPESAVQYIFSSTFAGSSDRNQIREKTNQMLEASRGNWHRFRLSVPDIDFGTPDENLIEIYECCKKAKE
jgi:uroporphyrinogen-III decarboxylase